MNDTKRRSAKLSNDSVIKDETLQAVRLLMDQLWKYSMKREFVFLAIGFNTPIQKECITNMQIGDLEVVCGKFTGKICLTSNYDKPFNIIMSDRLSEFINDYLHDKAFILDINNRNEYLFKRNKTNGIIDTIPLGYESISVYISSFISKHSAIVRELKGLTVKKYMMERVYYTGLKEYCDRLVSVNPYKSDICGHTIHELASECSVAV